MVLTWQVELAEMLVEKGQSHLFEHWPEPGVDDGEKKAFFDQVFFIFIWNSVEFFLFGWIY